MSSLFVYHESSPDQPNKVLTHAEDIISTLAEHGVRFDRLQAATRIAPDASQEEVISAYREQIDALMTERGYATVDVISVNADHLEKVQLRGTLLDEHRHEADEVLFFVAGRGLLTLHIEDYVYAVLCEKNDLIRVPAGTRQWFDMGEHPHLIAIRLFSTPDGQSADPTGQSIARDFPQLDDL